MPLRSWGERWALRALHRRVYLYKETDNAHCDPCLDNEGIVEWEGPA